MLESLTSKLLEWRGATRMPAWPESGRWRIAAFAPSTDPAHVDLFLDAAETLSPKSTVQVFTPGGNGAGDSAKTLEAASGSFDLAVMLHPYPWIAPDAAAQLPEVRRAFSRCGAMRKWIYFRNLELWDGSLKSRLRRRALDLPLRPLLAMGARRERAAMERVVFPRLAKALEWSGDAPCAHPRAELVMLRPRPIFFCPDCGMGFTPPDRALSHEALAAIYGEGFAQSFHCIGRKEWRRYIESNAARVGGFLKAMGFDPASLPEPQRRVLDYGCGSGRYVGLWLGLGWSYVGADPSEANVRFAREHAPAAPGRVEFVRGELGDAALSNGGPYGAIFLSHVIEHIPDPISLLARLRALAAPGGWLYLECPNAKEYAWNLKQRGYANAQHISDFTPATLAAVVRSAGWSDIRQTLDPDPQSFPHQALLARAMPSSG